MRKKRIGLWMILFLLLCCCAQAEESAGILYRVEGGKGELHLLGSIHVGSEEMYPMGAHILQAIQNADTLVFECDTESTEALGEMMALMYYPKGDSAEEHLGPECMELLQKTAVKTGYSFDVLCSFKPWAIVSLFSVETTAAGMGTQNADKAMKFGVESQVKALAGAKPVRYLETMRQQLEIMDGFSSELQEYMLRTACETVLDPSSVNGMDSTLDSWPEWWKNGEDGRFAAAYQQGMQEDPHPELMKEYHDGLVTRRNQRMAEEIAGLLEEDGSCFVTVGLMHLVLPGDSICSELEKMGFQLQKIMP